MRVLLIVVCLTAIACGGVDTRSAGTVLDCINGYDDAQVPADATVVLDAVALPTNLALPVVEDRDAEMFWTKHGLIVASGKDIELRVADEWRGRFGFAWGRPPVDPVESIRVPSCVSRTARPLLAFTGGFYVTEPNCVAVIVSTGGKSERVEIGVGAACAGQDPPVNPTRPS
jgi:hypothetical protein